LAFQTKFNKELDRLYRRRTDELRSLLSRDKPGPPKRLTKARREATIRKLKEIASRCLASKMWNLERKKYHVVRKRWPVLGRGLKQKRANFRQWLKDEVPRRHGKVYVFLRGKECRYVGRTRTSGKRPTKHFARKKFTGTTRIDVYSLDKRSAAPLLECLTIHHLDPARNKIRAAKQKWCPKCPLCKLHKRIRTKVRQIFRFP